MASMIVCDRCGKSSSSIRGYMRIMAFPMKTANCNGDYCKERMDVCKDCYKKIFKNIEEDDDEE